MISLSFYDLATLLASLVGLVNTVVYIKIASRERVRYRLMAIITAMVALFSSSVYFVVILGDDVGFIEDVTQLRSLPRLISPMFELLLLFYGVNFYMVLKALGRNK